MASGDERATAPPDLSGVGVRLGIVSARWNAVLIERLRAGVDRALTSVGVEDAVAISVPGSFEIPMGASILARSGRVDAVVTLGVVIRGETTHYELVSEGCAHGIQQVQLTTGVPVTFGVLTVEDEAQALVRSEGPGGHNVGEEAALAAVEMARLAAAFGPA